MSGKVKNLPDHPYSLALVCQVSAENPQIPCYSHSLFSCSVFF
uniref:Uncharacterized protein n=1 Tax=Rhizophora mucronata TaxID=61149 RepID=A0A2P2LZ23_RHIMU